MSRLLVSRALRIILMLVMIVWSAGSVQGAEGEPAWRTEFNDVCGRTADTEEMPTAMLIALRDRCEKLKPQIEKLEESERKVMRRRLKMCCDLYQFMVDTKENQPKQ